MNIHQKIEVLRSRKGLTQQALANAVGVSHRAVFAWEHDAKPRKSAIMKLAEVFEVDPSVLIDDSVDIPKPTEIRIDKKSKFPPEFYEWLDAIKQTTAQESSHEGRSLVEIMDAIDKKLGKLIEKRGGVDDGK